MYYSAQEKDTHHLKSLHREIDLYDRKLAHLAKHESFPTEAKRDSAIARMANKRLVLANEAKQMANAGTPFNPTDLPRSFREELPAPPSPLPEELHA